MVTKENGPVRELAVPAVIGILKHQLDKLEQAVQDLETRLEPVMSQHVDKMSDERATTGVEKKQPALVEDLGICANRIKALADRSNDLMVRLEV